MALLIPLQKDLNAIHLDCMADLNSKPPHAVRIRRVPVGGNVVLRCKNYADGGGARTPPHR